MNKEILDQKASNGIYKINTALIVLMEESMQLYGSINVELEVEVESDKTTKEETAYIANKICNYYDSQHIIGDVETKKNYHTEHIINPITNKQSIKIKYNND